ncbi:MAG: NUDIX hydrolase [bacterium]|nr:NUDIX hydrolase [bacterium]
MQKKVLKPWQVIGSKVAFASPWVELIQDTCIAGEQELTYAYMRRVDEGPLIIPEASDGSLWLVRQYRHPIRKIVWQFPVEGKTPGESWSDAAQRGLHEELEMQANSLQDLGEFFPDPGGLSQRYHAFLARELESVSVSDHGDGSEEVEDLDRGKFTLAEIDQMIASGDICDNWTLAALYLYQRSKTA